MAVTVAGIFGYRGSHRAQACAAEFFALLGGGLRDANWDGSLAPASRLAILPGMTHYNIGPSPKLAAAVADFLG
jgi:hypothetical protein